MSKERLSEVFMNSELLDLESSLKGLLAVGNVNRDELLFEAGRRSANHRSTSRSRIWKGVSTVLTLLLAAQSFLFWPSAERKTTDDGLPREIAVTPEDRTLAVDTEFPDGTVVHKQDHRTLEALPVRSSELLKLRRVALARGVDAAFSTSFDEPGDPTEHGPTQQDLLLELLGS